MDLTLTRKEINASLFSFHYFFAPAVRVMLLDVLLFVARAVLLDVAALLFVASAALLGMPALLFSLFARAVPTAGWVSTSKMRTILAGCEWKTSIRDCHACANTRKKTWQH
jgi:hypothetical protein